MPSFDTTRFGKVDYDERGVVDFPAGLPGFDAEQRFVLVEPAEHAPVIFLQSLASPDLCFVTLPVDAIDPAYELALSSDDRRVLALDAGEPPPGGLLALAILCLPASGPATANLLGPVVIHRAARRGVQAIRFDLRYPARYMLPVAAGEEETVCS